MLPARWLSIMDRMLMNDLLKTITSVLLVLVVIIVSRNFMSILKMAVAGSIDNQAILILLALRVILASVNFMVPAVFIAVLMVMGRLYRDQEMSAFSSAGVGIFNIYQSIFKTIIPIVLFSSLMSFYTAPKVTSIIEALLYEQKQNSGVRAISEGNFSEYSQGDFIFYAEKITSKGIMHDVFVQNKRNGTNSIINAQTALLKELNGGLYIIFMQGERIQGSAGSLNFILEYFDEYAMRIEDVTNERTHSIRSYDSITLFNHSDLTSIRELQRRLAVPLGIIMLVVMAVPLAHAQPRGGVYGNMLTAFLVYFSFSNFEGISGNWMLKGKIPIWLGFSGLYLLGSFIISLLLIKLYGHAWIMLNIRRKIQ